MAVIIDGTNNNDKITATDGLIDLLSSVNFASEVTVPSFKVGSDIQLGNAGIVTATTFIGNLTGNVNSSSNLLLQIGGSEKFRVSSSGQLGIGGANYGTSGQVLTSGGSSSAATWSTISGTTINNNAANKVIMGSNTANTLEAVAKSSLFSQINHGQSFLDDNYLIFGDASDLQLVHQSSGAKARIRNTNDSGSLDIESTLTRFTNKDGTTEKVRIDSSGRVFIGGAVSADAGSDNLVITEPAGGYAGMTLRSAVTNPSQITFANQNTTFAGCIQYDNSSNFLRFFVNGANERLRITSGGLVGVGQATPTHMLHVDSSNASDSTATAFFKGRIIRFDGAASSDSPRLNFSLDGTDKAQILLHRTNVGLDVATLAAEPIKFKINSVEKLRITSAGTPFVKADGTEPVNQAEAGHYGGSGYSAGNALGLMVKRAIHVSDADTKGVGGMFLSHTRNVACNGTAYNMFTLHNREGTFVGDIYVGFSGNSSGAVRKYTFACLYNTNNLTSVLFNRRSNNDNLTVNIVSSNTSHFFQVVPTKSGGGTERVSMTIVGACCGRNDGAGGDFYTVTYN